MEDIICDMKFDGKHSYEDNIIPVEEPTGDGAAELPFWEASTWISLIRSECGVITERCRKMLELAQEKGGYALGSGNSIPEYIPNESTLP